ncbi:hypothetical protein ACOSQ2_017296 [Xanthoceras sorbifolium]
MLETKRSEAEKKKLRDDLEAIRRELATGEKCEKELAMKVHRCQALRKDMVLKMNASAAKYKYQIGMLKDEISRAKTDLQLAYELIEQ